MDPKTTPLLLALAIVLFSPPGSSPAAAAPVSAVACGDIFPSMGLGPFEAEAETTPFFAGVEGNMGSFSVRWTGIACGRIFHVDAAYNDIPGAASEPEDYEMLGGRTPSVCEVGCPNQESVEFQVKDDSLEEDVVESFTISLSDPRVDGNPSGSALSPPPSVPFLIVDVNGSDRVAFDDLSYSRSETYTTMTIPVWRAGPAGGPVSVPFAVGPGTSATEGEDFTVTSPNPLTFNAGDRVRAITLSIANDEVSEADEIVELSLQPPSGATLGTPSTKAVTIEDNEEDIPPTSRFHHPRHRWKYKKSDYRIREFHIFAHDEADGSGIVTVELALRRNLMNGKCAWLTRSGWQNKDCQNRTWLPTKYSEAGDLFYYRMKQLKSSVKTRIKNYTAFSRAIDGAGNVEKNFIKKRNDNTFEIKRQKTRR